MKKIESIKGNSIYKITPIMMRQVVFTKKEIQEESKASINALTAIINQLLKLEILVQDDSFIRKGFRYRAIYDVYITG